MPIKTIMIFLLLAFSNSQAEELILLNWQDYLADEVVQAFQLKSGHSIRSVIYDRDSERDEILSSPSGQSFDLVVMDSVAAQVFGENKLLKKIDRTKIANLDNIDRRWRQGCGAYGCPISGVPLA